MNRENIILDHYILVFHPDHPRALGEGYVPEHILIMEDSLGRFLSEDEDVKHLDGNPHNNKIENLYLSSFQKEGSVAYSLLANRETAKRVSKTFINCRFQKTCWKEVRAPIAKANKVYLPYICSFQTEGDIYDCSHFWRYQNQSKQESGNRWGYMNHKD